MQNTYVIGVTGASGSGKSTFISALKRCFQTHQLSILSQDNYYKPRQHQPKDESRIENFDLPWSLDLEAFERDLISLKQGQSVYLQEYTYNNPAAHPSIITINPAPILLAEGLFTLSHLKEPSLIDLRIFIDAEEEIRTSRRMHRDKEERGYDENDVIYRLTHHHLPSFEKYILPTRIHADLIIPNNHSFDKALAILRTFLTEKLRA